jgi:hypothetical protein
VTDPQQGGPASPWPPASGIPSAPEYPPQVSAVPASYAPAYPVSAVAGMPAVPAKTSPWVWVLAGLSFVLLLTAGGVGALYMTTRSDNDKRVEQGANSVADEQKKADDLAAQKADLQKQISDSKADVDKAQGSLDALNKCQDAIQAFGHANQAQQNGTGTVAARNAALDAMAVACGGH